MNWAQYYLIVAVFLSLVLGVYTNKDKFSAAGLAVYVVVFVAYAAFVMAVVYPAAGINWGS